MKKNIKTVGIVALSAVLACGALGTLAGCGGGGGKPLGKENELVVSIFCNAADATTNQQICDEWAAEYSSAHSEELGGKKIKVILNNEPNKGTYFEQLKKDWGSDATADVIYLAPRYVRSYAENGNILDLSPYLTADAYKKQDGTYLTADVWQNGISYYGYIKGAQRNYKMGRPIEVNASGEYVTATNEANNGDDKGTKVGIYGLPKDYSNFSTGYNRNFFSEELKEAYTTTKATATRSVQGPKGETSSEYTSKLTYEGDQNKVITYAVTGDFTNPYTNETVHAVKGEPANIINVGIPVTYRPYNFFRWKSFAEAKANNDPVAVMSDAIGGYTVTLPGFPNDELKVNQSTFDATYGTGVDFNGIDVPYNKNIAHVTYTYAEYGALLWATTYYLNTFAWANNQSNPLNGRGGAYFANETKEDEKYKAIYGGEQYEGIAGATGSVLYLLPWLAANDADLINDLSTLTAQVLEDTNITDAKNWKSKAGTRTYSASKRTLTDTTVKKDIQYGHNSQNFIETYAAFLAIGSDWNGNPSGDTESTDRGTNGNGWAYFRSGRSLFYGAGSWDGATRNDVHTDILDFGQMPTPVAEKYALYSEIKDANYQKATYSNDPAAAAAGSVSEGNQRATLSDGCKVYSANEILNNQLRRQDKWAARMDTVGYAVAAKVEKYTGGHAWKKDAAVSLTARLTINEEAQKSLLYAGAQLPNFVSQCEDFVNYKTVGADGAFKDMLTPEGFYDTPEGNGKAVWDYYYDIALDMEEAAKDRSSQTVDEFLADKKHSTDGTAGTEAIRYDHSYGSKKLSEFTGEGTARIAFAMKVLRMVTYRADDRDINIRMQYGLNAVRDSSMYTYKEEWMGFIDARGNTNMLAYLSQKPLANVDMARAFLTKSGDVYSSAYIQMNPNDNSKEWSYMTPAVWCIKQASNAQNSLLVAVRDELDAMQGK